MDLVWGDPGRLGRCRLVDRPPGAHAVAGRKDIARGRAGVLGRQLMIRRLLVAAALMAAIAGPATYAVEPSERLADPALEARARSLSQELRCLVCQNQSIDESNADLAHDLRILLRQRLVAGDTDQQVLDYLSARYGVF